MTQAILQLDPLPQLLARVRSEGWIGPVRVSRAPAVLDVMGGVALSTGCMVLQQTLGTGAAVAIRARSDHNVLIWNLSPSNAEKPLVPFVSDLDAIVALARDRQHRLANWVEDVLDPLVKCHALNIIDLAAFGVFGFEMALIDKVPQGAWLGDPAAVSIAAAMAYRDFFGLVDRMPLSVAHSFARWTDWASPFSPREAVLAATLSGEANALHRFVPRRAEPSMPLVLPEGIRFLAIDSAIRDPRTQARLQRSSQASRIALDLVRHRTWTCGYDMGRVMRGNPIVQRLADIDPDDYKRLFRPSLPEQMTGWEFTAALQPEWESMSQWLEPADPEFKFSVRGAADHHVLEARRVANFVRFMEDASRLPKSDRRRGGVLDRCGHLMYASHLSYTNDAMLGADECDLLVRLVREREAAGLYGARITGGGCGGTVAVLANEGPRADAAIDDIVQVYRRETGMAAQVFAGSSPGAWHMGTAVVV